MTTARRGPCPTPASTLGTTLSTRPRTQTRDGSDDDMGQARAEYVVLGMEAMEKAKDEVVLPTR
jgi:hypothetical protein